MIAASAPGKVVLSGEYAVLDGAAAISMAVNRRARVAIVAGTRGQHSILAPGYSSTEGLFRVVDEQIEWSTGAAEYALVECVWHELQPRTEGDVTLMLDTREFLDEVSGEKTGIGSSAALAVALAAALGSFCEPGVDLAAAAGSAHRAFQDGKGSGVDIANSTLGGIIEYRMQQPPVALAWPEGLHFALLWSGVAASTAAKVGRLQQAQMRESRAALSAAAEQLALRWQAGEATALLQAYPAYCETLRAFSIDHDLGVFDAGHDDVYTCARDRGLVYKPCGAGGGDVGIVMGHDRSLVEAFADDHDAHGFRRLDVEIEQAGVLTTAEAASAS